MWPDLRKPALSPAYVIRAITRFRRLSNFFRFSFELKNRKNMALYALRSYNYKTGAPLYKG